MGEVARIEFTDDLADFAWKSAAKEARKRCYPPLDWNDIAQEVVLRLIRCPPKYDPSRGASKKTLIYIAVQCLVRRCIASAYQEATKFRQASESNDLRGAVRLSTSPSFECDPSSAMLRDLLEHVEGDKNRRVVRAYIENGGNASAAARQLGCSEGTIRYRLNVLTPQLRMFGLDLSAAHNAPESDQEDST